MVGYPDISLDLLAQLDPLRRNKVFLKLTPCIPRQKNTLLEYHMDGDSELCMRFLKRPVEPPLLRIFPHSFPGPSSISCIFNLNGTSGILPSGHTL